MGVPGQGSSPQFLHPLAGFVPELLRPRLARCPPAPLHLAVPYPHPALSGDDYSQKSHAQPPGQYPVAKGCQSDLCPERQITMTLAVRSRGTSLPALPLRCPSSHHWVGPLLALHLQASSSCPAVPARLHSFPDTSLQNNQKLAKTTIQVCGPRIWTRDSQAKRQGHSPLRRKGATGVISHLGNGNP